MAKSYILTKNPDEAARNAQPKMYTKSLEGGPPASEYQPGKTSQTTGPNDPLKEKPSRNTRSR